MRPLPPPRYAAAGYERVGLTLLAAATPPRLASNYNKRRGLLWGRLQSLRTAPSPEEFEREAQALCDLLRDAASAGPGAWDDGLRAELIRAARRLDLVEDAATEAGLLR